MNQESKIILSIGLAVLILTVVGVVFLSQGSTPTLANSQLLVRSDSTATGSAQAKLTVVEFGDFQCPACAQAHLSLIQLMPEYQGRVRFVFRHFPLPQHKNALLAAQVAEAAGAQGEFFPMHNLIYENQDQWSESADPQSIFLNYAKMLHLDTDKIVADLKDQTYLQKVNSDKSDGLSLGVNSTPTFYINGVKYKGSLSPDSFRQAFDQALSSL